MVAHYGVIFKQAPPSINVIINLLKEVSGVNVQYFEDTWEIVNPNDSNDGLSIYYQKYNNLEGITLTVFHLDMNYLLGVTLYVLVKLGGEYGHALPEWSSLKWIEYNQNNEN